MDYDQLVRTVIEQGQIIQRMKRLLEEHRHTGLDSKQIELIDQVQSQGSLTAKDTSTVDGTYGAEEAAVIGNNRTRIEEIENALISFGILE